MASINGVEIKNLEELIGKNGKLYSKGYVYIDGYKVGFWSEVENSFNDFFDFDITELQKRKETFECANYNIDLADFMTRLVDLKKYEDDANRYLQKGFSSVEIITGWFPVDCDEEGIQQMETYFAACNSCDGLDKESKEKILKEYFYRAEDVYSHVVTKPEDLDFIVNASDEVPNFLK